MHEDATLERQRQLEFERAQLELKFEYQKKGEELKQSKQGDATTSYAKLPKLTITKFNGTFEEWLSFWNKFTVEIDSTDLAPVTKFAYLKELVEPKVRANIDGLPFSTEGYERAKNILKSEYGKSSEIVNAYVSNIMELPTITSSNPKRVDEFYKKLLYNVQSLETLGKLRDVSGNARAVLDKLRGIKADLVRGEENWQEWDFVKLLQAIKRWRDINPVEESMDSTPHKSVQPSRTRVFNTLQGGEPEVRGRGCVYCDDESHKGIACTKFKLSVEVTKVDKSELLYLDNPKYEELIKTYSHLKGIEMADHDEKDQLPVHLILGAGEFAKLKVSSPPKIGQPGEPVGELTRFGWTIMSSGTEPVDLSTMLMTQTSHVDYEELCRLDVLGLQDTPTNDQGSVYEEFKEQLTRDKEGWYETGLPWKGDHRPLPNNKEGSLRRLSSLTRKLERQTLTEKYGEIIDEQKATGVVESAEIPAVEDVNSTSHTSQWGRFNPVALTGDLQKAFLQVRSVIRTRAISLSAGGSNRDTPQQLGGEREPEVVRKVRRELYVDDLISGSTSVSKALELKEKATIIFQDAGFKLHKWHSNAQELVESAKSSADDDTYAKQQLGTPPGGDCSLLGLGWNTNRDTLSVEVPQGETVMTKRGILAKLAKVYDPLGLVSPITLSGKIIYRSVCDDKIGWDVPLPEPLAKMWRKWESSLPKEVELPRSLAIYRDDIESIELHAFGDASANGVAACVYAVLRQASGTNQGLVAARSRLSKQGLTIPRLELVAGHMAVNLVTNVSTAIQGFPVSTVHCWLDSTVALHWIQGQGEYKQFVENRVRKIKSHQGVTWRHVPTGDNPADLASRGGGLSDAKLWWSGPQWLSNTESWPADIVPEPTTESKAENKIIRNVLSVAVEEERTSSLTC
ncbi:hypothetical protein QZH41_012605 [Actinostola sp. cb2023]|nr:hypothetical protein QZH41_012605 [Actinostola sp. cb2023]